MPFCCPSGPLCRILAHPRRPLVPCRRNLMYCRCSLTTHCPPSAHLYGSSTPPHFPLTLLHRHLMLFRRPLTPFFDL